ncbi:3-(3-hydroxy-phenyl)propionate/3-hydroxycinnamic acid hydroxylase [compost metagenome]
MEIEVIRAQPWSGHRVVAQRYREGRVFLLGDAAHLRWPKGGFGANTGVGDAVDLGWKLSAVLNGWGGSGLLDSYEAERRPIAVRNVNEAANNRVLDGRIAADGLLDDASEQGEAARREAENRIHALRLREFSTQGVQLGYRYRQSPLCVSDGSLEPPDDHMVYQPSTWPGSRAPHAWLEDGRSTLDLFGRSFVLLRFDGSAQATPFQAAAEQRGVPFCEVPLASSSIASLYERRYVLVRPDGHVAWRGDELPVDALVVIDRVRGA